MRPYLSWMEIRSDESLAWNNLHKVSLLDDKNKSLKNVYFEIEIVLMVIRYKISW